MSKIVPIQENNPLIGQWKSADNFSEVLVTIRISNGALSVTAIDEHDREEAEVSKISHDKDVLSFTLYWPSTGRQVSYRFMAQSKNVVNVSYTYTSTEIWQRT